MLPNALHYRQHPTAREAFNLAASLWHLIDWIFEDPRLNPQRQQKSALQATLHQQCPALGVMHDITTLYKHARITKPQGKVAATDVEMLGATFYFGPGGPVRARRSGFRTPGGVHRVPGRRRAAPLERAV